MHRFVLHGGLARGPASLAKTLLLIFYGHSLSLGGVLGLDRLNGLRVDHVSVLRSNIKVGGLHDALSLGNFNFLFRFVCLVLEVEVGVVGGADGMRVSCEFEVGILRVALDGLATVAVDHVAGDR